MGPSELQARASSQRPTVVCASVGALLALLYFSAERREE
jgi:hypothetical protein